MIQYKPVSLADQVYDRLEADILSGAYPLGEILSEKRLATELGVSRTPIREALSRLLYENLIQETPNGSVVLGITKKDVEDMFQIKMRIEVLATRWVCQNVTDAGLHQLTDLVEQQEFYAPKGDVPKVRDLDTAFHDAIYSLCGSPVLERVLSPIHHKMMKYRRASLELERRLMESVQEHRDLLEAILRQDEEQAEALMLRHLEHARNSILETTGEK